ncbi:glycosyltransferase family 2 protein [Campylobacter lari]|uniref:glycosyltransferase family 2 protein n=1 Tax=Campylobacter lari TaxID=201 RepID=UPI00372A5339
MNNPLVSIIIPIYNVAPYLKECLDSVINQTYRNLDIILVNDGSDDESLDIALEYLNKDERIFLISKENGGQSSARNMGLEFIKGTKLRSFFEDNIEQDIISFTSTHTFDKNTKIINKETIKSNFIQIQKRYIKTNLENINDFLVQELPNSIIHFLDSDDYFLNNCIELCVKEMVEKDLDICTHNLCRFLENQNKFTNKHHFDIPNHIKTHFCDLASNIIINSKRYSFVFTWQGAFQANILNQYNLRFTHGIYNEDNDFGIILFMLSKKFFFINTILMVYRVRDNSSSSKKIRHSQIPKYLHEINLYFNDIDKAKAYFYHFCLVKSGIAIHNFYTTFTNKNKQSDIFFHNSLSWHCNIIKTNLSIDPLNIKKLSNFFKQNKILMVKHIFIYLIRHPKKIKNLKNLFLSNTSLFF